MRRRCIIFQLYDDSERYIICKITSKKRPERQDKCNLPPKYNCPICASIILSLIIKERKYWMRDEDVIASSTLFRPLILVAHLNQDRQRSLLYLVSLLNPSTSIIVSMEKRNLSKAICSLSLITTTTLSTLPYMWID